MILSCLDQDKIILPTKEPIVATYTNHAHYLSILGTKNEALPWIYSNYIQLYICIDYIKNSWSNFYFSHPYELSPVDFCKWLRIQKIDRSFINTEEELINFVEKNLQNNYYIRALLNYSYLTITDINMYHDIFIYGINRKDKKLYVADFFVDGKYLNKELKFDEFTKSFFNYELSLENDNFNGMIHLYKLKENCDYKFDINNIKNSIKGYLKCEVPEYWDIYNNENRDKVAFGLNVYDVLEAYLLQVGVHKDLYVDIRPFILIMDHKKIMVLRLKYLITNSLYNINSDYIEEYNDIYNESKLLANLAIKYRYKRNNKIRNTMCECLKKIKDNETRILQKVI